MLTESDRLELLYSYEEYYLPLRVLGAVIGWAWSALCMDWSIVIKYWKSAISKRKINTLIMNLTYRGFCFSVRGPPVP